MKVFTQVLVNPDLFCLCARVLLLLFVCFLLLRYRVESWASHWSIGTALPDQMQASKFCDSKVRWSKSPKLAGPFFVSFWVDHLVSQAWRRVTSRSNSSSFWERNGHTPFSSWRKWLWLRDWTSMVYRNFPRACQHSEFPESENRATEVNRSFSH